MISKVITPLVMERSRVQSSLAAPSNPVEISDESGELCENPTVAETANSANRTKTRDDERGESGALSALEIAHFWGKVSVGQDFECWPWTGRKNAKGYGRFRHTGAHRVALELICGPIPEGLMVRHRCDNPPCCNPSHLEPGTASDNMQDAVERDRIAYGSGNGRTKLTDAQVAYIWANPERLTGDKLAAQFGIAKSTVSYVRNGGRRQRVTGPIAGAQKGGAES